MKTEFGPTYSDIWTKPEWGTQWRIEHVATAQIVTASHRKSDLKFGRKKDVERAIACWAAAGVVDLSSYSAMDNADLRRIATESLDW